MTSSDILALAGSAGGRLAGRLFPDVLSRIDTPLRQAFLTFDDGPSKHSTPLLLDILSRYNIRATFFVLGENAVRDPELLRGIRSVGHTVGNHSFKHNDAWKSCARTVVDDLDRSTRLLEDLTEGPISWMRPPYGHFTPSIRQWCMKNHQRLTLWDILPADFSASASSKTIDSVMRRWLRPGSIIALHDNCDPRRSATTAAGLDLFLESAVQQGWQFDVLPQ